MSITTKTIISITADGQSASISARQAWRDNDTGHKRYGLLAIRPYEVRPEYAATDYCGAVVMEMATKMAYGAARYAYAESGDPFLWRVRQGLAKEVARYNADTVASKVEHMQAVTYKRFENRAVGYRITKRPSGHYYRKTVYRRFYLLRPKRTVSDTEASKAIIVKADAMPEAEDLIMTAAEALLRCVEYGLANTPAQLAECKRAAFTAVHRVIYRARRTALASGPDAYSADGQSMDTEAILGRVVDNAAAVDYQAAELRATMEKIRADLAANVDGRINMANVYAVWDALAAGLDPYTAGLNPKQTKRALGYIAGAIRHMMAMGQQDEAEAVADFIVDIMR